MSMFWLKVKLWTKVAAFVVVAVYALVFVIKNTGKTAELWLWYGTAPPLPLLLYTLIVFLVGVLGAVLGKTLWMTIAQFREVRRRSAERRREEMLSDMEAKAAMVQTRPDSSGAPGPTESSRDLSGGGNVAKD